MTTTIGAVTREQVDVPTAMEELRAFLNACRKIENAEIKVIREWHMRRVYNELAHELESKKCSPRSA